MTNGEYQQLVEFLNAHFSAMESKFAGIDRKFDAIDTRFNAVDARFNAVDARFAAIDEQLSGINAEFIGINARFARLDAHFVGVDAQFAAVDRRFTALEHRFDGLERRFEEGFRDILGHLDAIYQRLGRLEQEYQAVVEALRRIERLLSGEQAERETLERNLADLRERVALLQARIDELERRLRA